MTYSIPMTWYLNESVSAPTLNTHVRDNTRWMLGHSDNPFPFARARSSVSIGLASGQFSTLTYDTVDVSRGGLYTSGSALICPIAGMIVAGACVEFEASACNKALRLIVNAASTVTEQDISGVGSDAIVRLSVVSFFHVDIGDFIEAEAFQDLGVNVNAVAQSSYSPVLWGAYVAVDD